MIMLVPLKSDKVEGWFSASAQRVYSAKESNSNDLDLGYQYSFQANNCRIPIAQRATS